MSHFTKVATKINDLVALKKALDQLGWKYKHAEQGVEVRGYDLPHDAEAFARFQLPQGPEVPFPGEQAKLFMQSSDGRLVDETMRWLPYLSGERLLQLLEAYDGWAQRDAHVQSIWHQFRAAVDA